MLLVCLENDFVQSNIFYPGDYDEALLKKYVEKFPNTGYSKIVRAFLRYKEGETIDEVLEVSVSNNGLRIAHGLFVLFFLA